MHIETEPRGTYRDAVVLYHWKQCGHCKTFKPVFQEAMDTLNMPHVSVYAIEVMEQREKLVKLGVDLGSGVPRVLLYNHAGAEKEYDGPRTVSDLHAAIREYMPASNQPSQPSLQGGSKVTLDAISVKPSDITYPSIVLYYSLTCGFCRAFFPTYLQFASADKPPGLTVLAVDVKRYPRALPSLQPGAGSKTVPHVVFHTSPSEQHAFRERRTMQQLVAFAEAQLKNRGQVLQAGFVDASTSGGGAADVVTAAMHDLQRLGAFHPSQVHIAFVGWNRQLTSPQDRLYIMVVNNASGNVGVIQGKRKGPLVASVHADMDVEQQIRRKLRGNFEPARFTDAVFKTLQQMNYSLDF